MQSDNKINECEYNMQSTNPVQSDIYRYSLPIQTHRYIWLITINTANTFISLHVTN